MILDSLLGSQRRFSWPIYAFPYNVTFLYPRGWSKLIPSTKMIGGDGHDHIAMFLSGTEAQIRLGVSLIPERISLQEWRLNKDYFNRIQNETTHLPIPSQLARFESENLSYEWEGRYYRNLVVALPAVASGKLTTIVIGLLCHCENDLRERFADDLEASINSFQVADVK